MKFERISTETVFEGRVFSVRKEQVHYPDGRVAKLDIVAHAGAVTIVPFDEHEQIWFIRQYRHPAAQELLELPAGVAEAGEDAQASAQRELREEIGMGAHRLDKLGEFFLAPGYSTEFMQVFLARDLFPEALEQDEDELMSTEKYSLEEALQMVRQGEILDAKTITSLFLAQQFLQGLFGN